MSDSPLVDYRRISPYSSVRAGKIIGISPHTMAGNLTVEGCGECFQAREASSNYGIGGDGRIAQYVRENRRAWCTSSKIDHQVVSIEVASMTAKEPFQCSEKAWASLVRLCVDICQRNGITGLLWDAGKKALVQGFAKNSGWNKSCNLVPHRWFAAKSCPGTYLYENYGRIADEVNAALAAEKESEITVLEVDEMTEKEVKALISPLEKKIAEQEAKNAEQEAMIAALQKKVEELNPVIYNSLEEIKAALPWAYEMISDQVERGIIKGDQHGQLGLTESAIRERIWSQRDKAENS